jgi:hypothetical protein
MANKVATLKCSITECEMTTMVAGGTYIAYEVRIIGDRPVIADRACTSGESFGAILFAPLVSLAASTASSLGTAGYTSGQTVYLNDADCGAQAGTAGDANCARIGTAMANGAKTATSILTTFESNVYLAEKNAHRA